MAMTFDMTFDRRITPARPDLAAAFLKGKAEAARFVEGRRAMVARGRAGLHARPDAQAPLVSELLFGELVTIYDSADGWSWVQAGSDDYVGYVRDGALGAAVSPAMRVPVLLAPVFSGPDLKTPVRDLLPMNAHVSQRAAQGDYIEAEPDGFVHRRHLAPLDWREDDFVAVAERFLGVPYVWGGKTFAGLDCSGLVQTALAATGVFAPRDTDMMESSLGHAITLQDARRGDLVFWKGHMGVVLDGARLLHANAFHMQVAIEPLAGALARIEKTAGPVTAVKRL